VNVVLSSGDEATHSPVHLKVLAVDDAGNMGAILAEALIPGPIEASAPGNHRSRTADQVPIVPPTGGCDRKCLHIAARWSDLVPLVDQVMTQVELPPYRGPHNPLDLIAIEIIFGRMFEAFQRIS
jgi:hypothetical protein